MQKEKYKLDIFLSYSHDQYGISEKIYNFLIQKGYTVFYDKKAIKIGESSIVAIERALVNSKNFLVLVGPNAFLDNLQRKNLCNFRELSGQERKVLPVIVDDCSFDYEFSSFLKNELYICWNPRNENEFQQELLRALGEPEHHGKNGQKEEIHKENMGKEWSVEIKIDEDYDDLTLEDQEKLLQSIEDFLGKDIRVSIKKRGSVK